MDTMHDPASAIGSFSTNERHAPPLPRDACLARGNVPAAYRHVENVSRDIDKATALTMRFRRIRGTMDAKAEVQEPSRCSQRARPAGGGVERGRRIAACLTQGEKCR
jgi:hypothetical protein